MREKVKIRFDLEGDLWHGYAAETVWAERVGPDQYEIMNTPFYACGVSYCDVVEAKVHDEMLAFQRVVSRSGHSTYRIIVIDGVGERQFERYWKPLEKLGCTYEGGPNRLFAIDVPPEADINKAYDLLDQGEQDDVWGFEEGHCGHRIEERQ